jgi:hypothetical protein
MHSCLLQQNCQPLMLLLLLLLLPLLLRLTCIE